MSWNHNLHYHDLILKSVPPNCRRVLDVGCGEGELTRRLAARCQEVTGIDLDRDTLARAQSPAGDRPVTFLRGDVMKLVLLESCFDLITAVAVLHHLPLRPALARFDKLLSPGGSLVVIGLYRAATLADYLWAAAAFPTSWLLRCVRGFTEVAAPVVDPKETLGEIREACAAMLPGAVVKRRLLSRYSLIWRKPYN